MKTQLILTMGGRGGVGKTVALVAIADYLQAKGQKFFCTDCDTENGGKLTSFGHWFHGKAETLNLRNTSDCDKLLEGSGNSGVRLSWPTCQPIPAEMLPDGGKRLPRPKPFSSWALASSRLA
jgi:hypothetical protein